MGEVGKSHVSVVKCTYDLHKVRKGGKMRKKYVLAVSQVWSNSGS